MDTLIGYQRLIIWQKADQITFLVYKISARFPKSEVFSITSQLRRAALSIPTNIVEGYARNSKKEFKRFLVIALGSLAETRYLIDVAFRLEYLSKEMYAIATSLLEEEGKLLWSFYRSQ